MNTSAAAVPKMKKSYHSMVVPTRLASATLRDVRRDGPVSDAGVAVGAISVSSRVLPKDATSGRP